MITDDIRQMAIAHEKQHGVKPSRVHLGRRQMDDLKAFALLFRFHGDSVAGDGAELPNSVHGLTIVEADAEDQLAVVA